MAQVIEPGTVIGGTYEVTGLLGKGGMGAVWSARHLRLPGKRVAIKVLLAGGDDDEQSLARFRREAEIASRLGHPNIVAVSDFNTFPDGTPYQVLEFLDGESLGARLKRGPIPLDETMGFARQMGSALAAAHREGIVHRDLKPENIFLCPTEAGGQIGIQVKILDFGISKIRGSQTVKTQDQVLIGTPQYMSPEQAHGENQSVDQRTDVFALGAIMYEMLSGRAAFAGDSVVTVILNVVQKTPEALDRLVPGLAPGVVAAIGKALAKKPDERFQDVAAFILALTGRPLETRPLDAVRTGPGGAPAPAAGKPLSQEEILAATMAPASVPSPAASPASMSHSIPPGTPATVRPVARSGGSGPVKMIFVGVAIAGVTAAAVMLANRPGGPAGITAGSGGAPAATVTASTASRAPDAGSAAAGPADAAAQTIEHHQARVTPRPRGGTDRDADVLPPAVAAEISEAETLLAAGNPAEAVRKARHSLLGHRAARAFAVLARAACQAGDLTNARAALLNIKGGQRARVIRDCAKHGLDLR